VSIRVARSAVHFRGLKECKRKRQLLWVSRHLKSKLLRTDEREERTVTDLKTVWHMNKNVERAE
jgi:hypothetical protein